MKRMSKKNLVRSLSVIVLLCIAVSPAFSISSSVKEWKMTIQTEVANLHSLPAQSASVLDTLKLGDEVFFLQSDDDWIAVRLPDKHLGWIHQSAFKKKESLSAQPVPEAPEVEQAPAPFPEAEVIVPSGRVRETPSLKADVHYGVKKGDVVSILEEKNGWWMIRLDGEKTGWASSRLFKRLPLASPVPESAMKPKNKISTPELPSPAEKTENSVSPDEAAQNESFFQAVLKSNTGQVHNAPSSKSEIAFILKKNARVTVIDTKGDWFQILMDDGRTGWSLHSLFTLLIKRELRDIRFAVLPGGYETITFTLNSFNPPNIFTMDDDETPKIVCDFLHTLPADNIPTVFPAPGEMVKRIRLGIHKDTSDKVRVVVELNPAEKYHIEQIFIKKKNKYMLTVKPLPEPAG